MWNCCSITSPWYLRSKLLISNLIFLLFLGDNFLISAATIMPNKSSLVGVDCNDLLMSSIICYSLLGFSGAYLTSSLRFFALQCLCHKVSNDCLVETLENKLFLKPSLKLSSASVMPSSFVLISATFVFGRLLTVFSLSLKYGASQLCFVSRLPEPDLAALLYFAFFSLNLFFKLSNRRLASPRSREKMCYNT